MKLTLQNTTLLLLATAFLIALCAVFYFTTTSQVFAGSPPGIPAVVATSSNPSLPAGGSTLVFATSTCSARVIAASSSPLMISFSDIQGQIPSVLTGIQQLASTTVLYDSERYGCGAVRIWSKTADIIGVMESR